MCVHGDQLFRLLVLDGSDGAEEIDKLLSRVASGEEKVDAFVDLLDVDGVSVCLMLENELLEVEESSLVGDLLAHLDDGAPGVVGEGFGAIRALLVGLDKLDLECLLEDGTLESLLLDCDFEFDSPRVRLGPDEAGIDDSHFGESSQLA